MAPLKQTIESSTNGYPTSGNMKMYIFNRSALELKMQKLKIKQYKKVYRQCMVHDSDFMKFIENRNHKLPDSTVFQMGGGKPKKLRYIYDNTKFVLYELKHDAGYDISVHRKDEIDNPQTCLHIMIDPDLKLAYIQNISYYADCVDVGLTHPGGGSMLLKMCIQFLKDTKDKYKVARIQLKDNSYLPCKQQKSRMMLSTMYTLMNGDTWYGKYGFRPHDPFTNTKNIQKTRIYNRNKTIVTTTNITETNLFKHIFSALNTVNPANRTRNKNFVKKLHKKYKNFTITQFFRHFMFEYEHSCDLILLFYIDFYTDQKLYSFHGESFYLDV